MKRTRHTAEQIIRNLKTADLADALGDPELPEAKGNGDCFSNHTCPPFPAPPAASWQGLNGLDRSTTLQH